MRQCSDSVGHAQVTKLSQTGYKCVRVGQTVSIFEQKFWATIIEYCSPILRDEKLKMRN